MKMPTPHFLITNPDFIIKSKITLWWLESSFHLKYNLLINIYKRLYTNVCKRVLNENKRLISDIESDYQMVEKIIGIAPMGELGYKQVIGNPNKAHSQDDKTR